MYNSSMSPYNILTALQCLDLPPIANGSITYAPDNVPNFDLGTVATYECDTGYILSGNVDRICVEGGENSGLFNRDAPVCLSKKCT